MNKEFKECSGDSASCPENEGHGCCKPNAPALPQASGDLPVAWMWSYRGMLCVTTDRDEAIACGSAITGLYFAPPTQAIAEAVRSQALEQAATVIELYDDATMKGDYMLSADECAEIIRALKTAAPSQGAKQ